MYKGRFEGFGSGEVIGWVAKDGDAARILVQLYVDDKFVLEDNSDYFRKDLFEAGIGDGKYAFYLRVPNKYFDNKVHSYEVRVRDEARTSLGRLVAEFKPGTPYQDRSSVSRGSGAGRRGVSRS